MWVSEHEPEILDAFCYLRSGPANPWPDLEVPRAQAANPCPDLEVPRAKPAKPLTGPRIRPTLGRSESGQPLDGCDNLEQR